MQIEVAGVGRQRQRVEGIGLVRPPEPHGAAVAAADRRDKARGMIDDAPAGPLEGGLWPQNLRAVACLPIEEDDRWITDAGEGVADIGDACACQGGAFAVERHAADAAVIGAKGGIVTEQDAAIHGARLRSLGDVPVANDAVQVPGNQVLAARVKGNIVDMVLMAGESADKGAVGRGP